jgi:hypothetical protein
MTKENTIDLVFSFDTTGSMYPCLTQVRRHLVETVKYLFGKIDNLRIGIMAHGDYCDGSNVLTILDLCSDEKKICEFVKTVKATNGGDSDECYELVLNRARTLSWTGGKNKALVVIGDANPHGVGYRFRGHCEDGSRLDMTNDLDWKNELELLGEAGISVIPIQAMGHWSSADFYASISEISGTPKLDLEQFSDINDIIMALCMSRAGKIEEFSKKLEKRGKVSYSVWKTVDTLSGKTVRKRKKSKHAKHAVHPSRFQILDVDNDCSIKAFVEDNGLTFKKGRGFYEFTKRVTIQDYKEVIIQDTDTGEMFSGDKAREILGIPVDRTTKVGPSDFTGKYRGFVQSTSVNRKLLGGTKFLYEVDELA